MPIRLRENPYKGVNPHLQSLLQTPGTQQQPSLWPSFHAGHIGHIADFLSNQLPSHYIAQQEQSLQIRAEDFGTGTETLSQRTPDVSIYQRYDKPLTKAGLSTPNLGARILTLEETIDVTEDFVASVVIVRITEDTRHGTIVARIELLLPSNLPGHTGYEIYRKNRADALYSEVPLIEIQYVHELPPPLLKVPVYPHHPDAKAYNIYVSDPRPSVSEGQLIHYSFSVDEPFEIVTIPLADEEAHRFDFGAVYQHTFATRRWGVYLDYEQLPARFETYSPADQARIKAKMAALVPAE